MIEVKVIQLVTLGLSCFALGVNVSTLLYMIIIGRRRRNH